MATPTEISVASACFPCVPDKLSAMLYLLAQIAGVTDPETISVNARCYECIPDKQSAVLYLLDQIATSGSGGSLSCAAGAPVAAPSGTCALYVDTDTDAIYIYRNGAWVLKV